MTERVVLAGGSGFVGRYLADRYRERGMHVTIVGRTSEVTWDDPEALVRAVDGAHLLINLAGRSVDCRYNAANRSEILESRVGTTEALHSAVRQAAVPPPLWVNSSTATIYRHAMDRPMTESGGELGEGFSVSIAKAWEQAFFAGETPGTRRAALRMAIVLGDGSVLERLVQLSRWGLGGPQWDSPWFPSRARRAVGTEHRYGAPWGRQKFSWVHVEDVYRIIEFLGEHPELEGPINASSPRPTDNVTLMRTLRRALGVPLGIPLPRPALEVGAAVLGTETELVLKSRWVVPERLEDAGFVFQHPEIDEAIRSNLGSLASARI
ncbi:hypothetical protein HDC94_001884 [Leifsonia sp. AK011]|uniref:epimerase n=1 Tax=Leifsonia sp. AK011 TaxID=2723075 RepID=UPI0015CC42D1|nr:DUF1731 domain-containing protein [Leifsonia sp. AK011]NYF10728.1 hypothetical protein [Leifsonia sp. AK011]